MKSQIPECCPECESPMYEKENEIVHLYFFFGSAIFFLLDVVCGYYLVLMIGEKLLDVSIVACFVLVFYIWMIPSMALGGIAAAKGLINVKTQTGGGGVNTLALAPLFICVNILALCLNCFVNFLVLRVWEFEPEVIRSLIDYGVIHALAMAYLLSLTFKAKMYAEILTYIYIKVVVFFPSWNTHPLTN